MGFTASKGIFNSCNRDNRSMGLLLVFFPEDQTNKTSSPISAKITSIFSSSSSSTPSSATRFIRRTSSSVLFNKAQSTISICALLVFLTLLLFTLSTFEPTPPHLKASRRFLSQKPPLTPTSNSLQSPPFSSFHFFKSWDLKKKNVQKTKHPTASFALQGMGTLYRRGTKGMNDLVVGHVAEDVSQAELRLSLRILHRSGVSAKADFVFIFASSSLLSRFGSVIEEENASFLRLVRHHRGSNRARESVLSFDVSQFLKPSKKNAAEPLWGKKTRGNHSNSEEGEGGSTLLNYGSVVGFEVNELDPENSLAGFLDHVPMSLRRWACYPMLLGRVRRNFKHIMLIDVKNLLLLGDPLGRVRSRSPESVYILTKQESSSTNKHSKRNSDRSQSHCPANSAILMGGARGIRRLSNAMLTEIVRGAMQHKKKNSVSDSGILSQLVGNEHLLSVKNVHLIASAESIPEASSLSGLRWEHSIIQRGNGNRDLLDSVIMKQICSCEAGASVYRDC